MVQTELAPIRRELDAALADQERFEALALVELNQDRLLFLGTAPGAAAGLEASLEDFLLRLVTYTESHDQFTENEDFLFYDLTGRQLVLHYFETKTRRCVLVAVVYPQKTYKQAVKKLAKTLKPLV